MCGRFTLTIDPRELEKVLNATFEHLTYTEDLPKPQYNIAPSENLLAIIYDHKQQQFRLGKLKWGFEPFYSKPAKRYQIINARVESIDQKPAFKDAFKQQRCLILADGFYEWQTKDKDKTPYYTTFKSQQIFAFAGIYSLKDNLNPSGAIMTMAAPSAFEKLHQRMPLMLKVEDFKTWLRLEDQDEHLKDWLKTHSLKDPVFYPVSKAVNSPKNKNPELIQPLN